MSFITKGRLVSLVSASAIDRHDGLGGSARVGHGGHARIRRDWVLSRRPRAHCQADRRRRHRQHRRNRLRHRCLQPGPRHERNIHGALYYGVVVNGGNVDTTGSKVHDIGDNPFDGMQRGRAILYINGATGTINGNEVYDFQKNGIEVRG